MATSVWLNELNLMRDRLVATIDDRLGRLAAEVPGPATWRVKRLRLVVGRIRRQQHPPRAKPPTPVSTRAPAPPRRARPLPPGLAATIASLVDEGLAAAIRRAWGTSRNGLPAAPDDNA